MAEHRCEIDRRIIVKAEDWDDLMARLDAPGEPVPELIALIERVRQRRG